MSKFANTVALISGGSRGMGAGHARALVAEGAKVVIGDVLVAEGEALAKELGAAAKFVKLDVTQEADWQAAVAAAEALGGPVNLLVNNAGIVGFGAITDMSKEDFERVMDINLLGVFLGMKHAAPSMKRAGGGAIINISSTAGMMGYANISAYVASKWAVRGITKAAAMEFGRDGIRVVSIHPGPIRTPMTDGMGDELVASQAIARYGEPEEVTKLILFLAADATFSTGSEFVIDGGALLGPLAPIEKPA
jgi:3alpha(or 20beta)-hydroxysteroid dehydrogenase